MRKTRPKLNTPFRVYIYCTLPKYPHEDFIATDYPKPQFYGGGKVIGEFICDRIDWIVRVGYMGSAEPIRLCVCDPRTMITQPIDGLLNSICLTAESLASYLASTEGYGWHISELKIYDRPKALGEFSSVCRYKNDDQSCQSRRVACSYQKYDYNPDGSINLVECGRTLERPRQSWCYVEEQK